MGLFSNLFNKSDSGDDQEYVSDPCISCGQSLKGGTLTLPWEDGNNSNAYVTCPHCGYENIKYGYGEDD